ncbi:sensor histidine kinase [Blautia stercoris]|uniref:histidine kinase n=1 Tax=Blautia stercoris TaxID=871664 RepID=A0ABR7PC69_9FIRM|nr:sensor histidine kinase [Blautia stercoris]MBC8628862.1 sensor histidine kinase [Blautia stercoris]RGF18668.1 sensor histidine kinase [Firmicutes bacterium AM10-47]
MKSKKVSIRVLVPVMISASIAVCVISCMILFSSYFSKYFQKNAIEKVDKQKKFLVQNLETEIGSMNEWINEIYYQEIKKYDVGSTEFEAKLKQKLLTESKNIYGIGLYDGDGKCIWKSDEFLEPENVNAEATAWFIQAKNNIETIHYGTKKLIWSKKANILEVSRYVEYLEKGTMKSGVLLLEYNMAPIDEILNQYQNQKTSYCYFLDAKRQLLYHPFDKQIASGLYTEKTIQTAFTDKNYVMQKMEGQRWLIEQQQIGYTGWNLVVVNSISSLATENYSLHFVAWLTLLLVGIILTFIDTLVFRNFTEPIYRLLYTMEKFGTGSYKVRAKEKGVGELKNLIKHFNVMADKLEEQMEEIRRNEQEKQRMEKKLLQSQINPHFLYNTLDSIIWMIRSEEYDGAGEMVSLLAKFFRISLSQGKDMIPLKKELEHATSYLAIQNIRFKDKFEFQVNADPNLLNYLCPKLSIQPLLENAIYHGMEGMYEDGEIEIRIYEKEGAIKIEVADNGPGMTAEKLDYIMHNKVISSKRGSGIGVRNVNERIQLIYGKNYGITIASELDEGTVATITIPKMEEFDET